MVEFHSGPVRTPILNAFARQYEQMNPGVKIDVISPSQADSAAKITQLLQAKNADIIEANGPIYPQALAAGQLADIAKQFKATKAYKSFTPFSKKISEQTTKGKIYAIPNGYYSKAAFVRADRFKAAGIPIPKTWQDIYNAKSMQKDNEYVYAMRGAFNSQSQAMIIVQSYVAPNMNETGLQTKDGKSIFSTPQAKTALDLLLKIWKEAAPAASVAWGYPDMVKGFHTGVANYLIQDNEVIQIIEENFEPYSKGNWVMSQIPKGPTGWSATSLSPSQWSVAQSSKCKNVALGFLDFISQDPQHASFARAYGLIPITTTAAKDPFFSKGAWSIYPKIDKDKKSFTYTGIKGIKLSTCYGKMFGQMDKDMVSLYTGDKTTTQVLKEWSDGLGGPECID